MNVEAVVSAIQRLEPADLPAVAMALAARMAAIRASASLFNDELIDAKEAAQILGRTKSFLYHAKGLSFAVKVGTRRKYSRAEIQKYINSNLGKE